MRWRGRGADGIYFFNLDKSEDQFEVPLDAVVRGYNSGELAVEHGGPQSVIWLEILIDSASTNG